jgi:hypothetical protein
VRLTIRVNVPEIPPGHADVPAASGPSKRRVQNRFPVSLSTAKIWLEGAAIVESGVKIFTPDVTTPAPSETPCRTGLSSLVFHCSSNPGCPPSPGFAETSRSSAPGSSARGGGWLMVSGEMLTSLRIHDVCCASPYAVGHSVGLPRPWLDTMQIAAIVATTAIETACRDMGARLTFLPLPGRRSCTSSRRTFPGRRARWRPSSRSNGSRT